jgi:exodeoxyribonuclease V alpha subunit
MEMSTRNALKEHMPSPTQGQNTSTLRPLDYHFGQRISRGLAPEDGVRLALVAALVSCALGEKEVCLTLDALEQGYQQQAQPGMAPPASWSDWLLATGRVSGPGGDQALILDKNRLYLSRYWHYEQRLAEHLLQLASHSLGACRTWIVDSENRPQRDQFLPDLQPNSRAIGQKDGEKWAAAVDLQPTTSKSDRLLDLLQPDTARAQLEQLFPQHSAGLNHQKLAAALALVRPLLFISGGPGTGKTHTVATIIALLLMHNPRLRIELAAPTGKAAVRLSESMRRFRDRPDIDPEIRSLMPDQAKTLHRLLGIGLGQVAPRHGPDNPLHLDLLVVDESSMIDLPLMYKTLAALPPNARLILLGDRDQLASVEAGSVFADLCGAQRQDGYSAQIVTQLALLGIRLPAAAASPRVIDQCRVELTQSWRFEAEGGIGQLARAVRAGQQQQTLALLTASTQALEWRHLSGQQALTWIKAQAEQGFTELMQAQTPSAALKALDNFRILCALRRGHPGVETINPLVEQHLRHLGWIQDSGDLYRGRPLMISRNDPALGLFNGDTGVLWPDEQGHMRAWFQLADGSLKALMPNRLPALETAFALSIHKAQGSEFTRLLLLLPDRADSPLLTRELLYTGISRAREQVSLLASPEVLQAALGRVVQRASGLEMRLRQAVADGSPDHLSGQG